MLINDSRRRILLSRNATCSPALTGGSNAGYDGTTTVCRKRPRQAWPAHRRDRQQHDPGLRGAAG
jgi:hypothetical protein